MRDPRYFLAPVGPRDRALQTVLWLVKEQKIFAVTERTFSRFSPAKGDKVCFYAVGHGIIASATIRGDAQEGRHPDISNPKYSFWFGLKDVEYCPDSPYCLTLENRRKNSWPYRPNHKKVIAVGRLRGGGL